jgi:hypothetical protein
MLVPFVLLVLIMPVPAASAAVNPPLNSFVNQEMLRTYCQVNGYRGEKLVENTAYGWRCEAKNGKLDGIYMAAVCAGNNKPTPNVIAWMYDSDYSSPTYAWRCTQLQHPSKVAGEPYGYQGRLDPSQACRMGGSPDGAVLRGDTVADWKCKAGDYEGKMDTQAACAWQYGGASDDYAVPVFNYKDPNTTTCWR